MRVCKWPPQTHLASRTLSANLWLRGPIIVIITILPAASKWRWLRDTQEQQRPQCTAQLRKGVESGARITDQWEIPIIHYKVRKQKTTLWSPSDHLKSSLRKPKLVRIIALNPSHTMKIGWTAVIWAGLSRITSRRTTRRTQWASCRNTSRTPTNHKQQLKLQVPIFSSTLRTLRWAAAETFSGMPEPAPPSATRSSTRSS